MDEGRGNRHKIQLATKCFKKTERGPNTSGLSRLHIKRAVEASNDFKPITSTCTNRTDSTPIRSSKRLSALDDLIREGKVRYVGCSNYPAWRLSEAAPQPRLGIEGYISIQPRYNLLYRDIETELLPLCRNEGLGVIVYNPPAGGFLSGKHHKVGARRRHAIHLGDRRALSADTGKRRSSPPLRHWKQAATARDVSLVTISVAWVLRQPDITSAIIGASSAAQLAANVAATEFEWDDELEDRARTFGGRCQEGQCKKGIGKIRSLLDRHLEGTPGPSTLLGNDPTRITARDASGSHAKAASSSPTTQANLNPCPENPAATMRCCYPDADFNKMAVR